jgi:hypothetical protein
MEVGVEFFHLHLSAIIFRKKTKMYSIVCLSLYFVGTLAQTQYTSTGTAAVAKARATALTESPTSNVAGKTFDRFVTICTDLHSRCLVVDINFEPGLENTDYSTAAGDRELNCFNLGIISDS